MDVSPSTSPAMDNTSVQSPPPAVPTNAEWLQPFIADEDSGLPVYILEVTNNPSADVVTIFRNCLVDFKTSMEAKGIKFADQLGFLDQYDQLQELKKKVDVLPSELATKNSALEWNFQQYIKAIFFIGHFTVPAMHFCGSVQPHLMAEEQPFHGFNER